MRGHQEIVDAVKTRSRELALEVIEKHMSVAYELVSGTYGRFPVDSDTGMRR